MSFSVLKNNSQTLSPHILLLPITSLFSFHSSNNTYFDVFTLHLTSHILFVCFLYLLLTLFWDLVWIFFQFVFHLLILFLLESNLLINLSIELLNQLSCVFTSEIIIWFFMCFPLIRQNSLKILFIICRFISIFTTCLVFLPCCFLM